VDDYHFRQEPGGANAMATAKIEFLSPFGIYLHDTPEPHLFKSGSRFYSSGCVRVEQVAILLDWILQGQDGLNTARIAELAQNNERLDVNITNPPQLRVAYLTAWPAKDGVAAFRPDIYDLDGSGFVVGQPLPVGETIDGKRFVLKPLPRLQQDIDVDTASPFASLFRRNKNEVAQPGQIKKNDSLINLKQTSSSADKQKKAAKDKKTTASAEGSQRWRASDKNSVGPAAKATAQQKADAKAKKKVVKKPVDSKAKATAAKKADGKPVKTAATDAKAKATKSAATTKTTTEKSTAAAAAAKKPAASSSTAAAPAKKAPADCKPGADGKLPTGCPASAPAKKPASTTGKTASAASSAAN
jgi:hypothetical protein